jgi:hypothetical protein
MRGLLIDRHRELAYWVSGHEASFVDPGNFLAHAVMNGMVMSIRWVHDPHGGRLYDDGGVVKYESDIPALPYKWAHRLSNRPERKLTIEELYFDQWDSLLKPGEILDIDWDAIASNEYTQAKIRDLTEGFLAREFAVVPETTFLVFSPDFSNPDRTLFEEFASRLADKFSAELVYLPVPSGSAESRMPARSLPWRVAGTVRRHIPKSVKRVKRSVLFKVRAFETRNDVRS